MQKSDDIKELAIALNKVQANLKPAKRNATNPFFKASYADLASIWESCRQLLADNGLSVVQTCSLEGESRILLDTTLLHSSGQWIGGQLLIIPVKSDPQGIGSALTYGRRYGLSAIVGIATEDDDGEGAMERTTEKAKPKEKPKETKESRLQRLARSAKKLGYLPEQISAYLPVKYGVKTSKELKEEQIIELTTLIEAEQPLDIRAEVQKELKKEE